MDDFLAPTRGGYTEFDGWLRIDAAERTAGLARGGRPGERSSQLGRADPTGPAHLSELFDRLRAKEKRRSNDSGLGLRNCIMRRTPFLLIFFGDLGLRSRTTAAPQSSWPRPA